jgi:protein-S-isoprenylcysteine O-methyltransferase Ste14
MFPVLVIVYARLARREEAEVAAEFSEEYAAYRVKTPALWPW